MNIAVPSRFACLKIEDDDFRSGSSSTKRKQGNKSSKKANGTAKAPAINGAKKKPSSNADVGKPKSSSKKQKKPKEEQEKNWEEWQRKDAKLVSQVFEEEMQNAMLESKLEFEQQKKNMVIQTEPEQSQGKKKKGKTTMSLDQFLDKNKEPSNKEETTLKQPEKNFFADMMERNQKVITKERVEQDRKKREEVFEEVVSLAHCQEELEAQRAKNLVLEKELVEARKEIALVKLRNTSLCSMLGQGEMKDKAQVLAELRRLTLVKEELTEEVANLHKLLEQERSNKNTQQYSGQTETHTKHGKEKIKKKKH